MLRNCRSFCERALTTFSDKPQPPDEGVSLWLDSHRAELPEVFIEGNRPNADELLDDDLAGAVCETPILVAELLEDVPSSQHLLRGQIMHRGEVAGEKACSERYRALAFAPHSQ
jgi:hypothetical protein